MERKSQRHPIGHVWEHSLPAISGVDVISFIPNLPQTPGWRLSRLVAVSTLKFKPASQSFVCRWLILLVLTLSLLTYLVARSSVLFSSSEPICSSVLICSSLLFWSSVHMMNCFVGSGNVGDFVCKSRSGLDVGILRCLLPSQLGRIKTLHILPIILLSGA